ncbi:MAG: hypothetical protein WA432_03555 [Candidatus Babeliaceae bacterium]
MNAKYTLFIGCLIMQTLCDNKRDFRELLKCNLAQRDIDALCDVENEILLYKNALHNESNYIPISLLEGWIDQSYSYPAVHPTHQIILDIIKTLNIESVCEVGAGCGKVSKYVYAENSALMLTCVEHNNVHCKQIEENFETRPGVIPPNKRVKAQIIKDCLPELATLPSHAYDLVFTCTVMMHLPFIKSDQKTTRLEWSSDEPK